METRKVEVPFRAGGPERHGTGTRDDGCFNKTPYEPVGVPPRPARTPEPVFRPNSNTATFWPTRSILSMNATRLGPAAELLYKEN